MPVRGTDTGSFPKLGVSRVARIVRIGDSGRASKKVS